MNAANEGLFNAEEPTDAPVITFRLADEDEEYLASVLEKVASASFEFNEDVQEQMLPKDPYERIYDETGSLQFVYKDVLLRDRQLVLVMVLDISDYPDEDGVTAIEAEYVLGSFESMAGPGPFAMQKSLRTKLDGDLYSFDAYTDGEDDEEEEDEEDETDGTDDEENDESSDDDEEREEE